MEGEGVQALDEGQRGAWDVDYWERSSARDCEGVAAGSGNSPMLIYNPARSSLKLQSTQS